MDRPDPRTPGPLRSRPPDGSVATVHGGLVAERQASISRTSGTTRVAYSSMDFISWLCGMGPLAYFRSNWSTLSSRTVAAILAATVSGDTTYSAPCSISLVNSSDPMAPSPALDRCGHAGL